MSPRVECLNPHLPNQQSVNLDAAAYDAADDLGRQVMATEALNAASSTQLLAYFDVCMLPPEDDADRTSGGVVHPAASDLLFTDFPQ